MHESRNFSDERETEKQKKLVRMIKNGHFASQVSLDGQGNVMEDIEDMVNANVKDTDLSIYREVDDIVQNIEGKEKNLKNQMDDDYLLSSTNKSMMSAFSPDMPQPFFDPNKKKSIKKPQEKKDKFNKYRPS